MIEKAKCPYCGHENDMTEALYDDGTKPPVPEGTIPINGDRHMKIKLRHKDYVYDCTSSIYRSWIGSEN